MPESASQLLKKYSGTLKLRTLTESSKNYYKKLRLELLYFSSTKTIPGALILLLVSIVLEPFCFRKLLQATIRANKTDHFLWIGSDSWGAKVHPVRDQEYAAEGAITILPHRNAIKGTIFKL